MNVFEIGKTYTAASPFDSELTWTYKCVNRTAKFVTLKLADCLGTTYKFKINPELSIKRKAESVETGRYAMAPVIGADMVNE